MTRIGPHEHGGYRAGGSPVRHLPTPAQSPAPGERPSQRVRVAEHAIIDDLLDLVRDELITATEKFGPMASAHEGYAVLLEELDELWDEVKANGRPGAYERMGAEALQVAAMAVRFLLDVAAPPGYEP